MLSKRAPTEIFREYCKNQKQLRRCPAQERHVVQLLVPALALKETWQPLVRVPKTPQGTLCPSCSQSAAGLPITVLRRAPFFFKVLPRAERLPRGNGSRLSGHLEWQTENHVLGHNVKKNMAKINRASYSWKSPLPLKSNSSESSSDSESSASMLSHRQIKNKTKQKFVYLKLSSCLGLRKNVSDVFLGRYEYKYLPHWVSGRPAFSPRCLSALTTDFPFQGCITVQFWDILHGSETQHAQSHDTHNSIKVMITGTAMTTCTCWQAVNCCCCLGAGSWGCRCLCLNGRPGRIRTRPFLPWNYGLSSSVPSWENKSHSCYPLSCKGKGFCCWCPGSDNTMTPTWKVYLVWILLRG